MASAFSFKRFRWAIGQIHLWIALVLCLPLVTIGLSGSILVFRSELAKLIDPPPPLAVKGGRPHKVAEILAAVQAEVGKEFTPYLYEASQAPEQPVTVRLIVLGNAGARPRVTAVSVNPDSLDMIALRTNQFPGLLRLALELHGDLLMGRAGRVYVGWLGVAMLILGLSGLILWWPRRRRWRAAFVIKRGARGLRLYRDLHGAIGIWAYFVFITVSFTGVYIVFPQTIGAAVMRLLPSREASSPLPVLTDPGAQRIDADQAIAAALSVEPGGRLLSIALPMRHKDLYRVSLAHRGDSRGAPEIVAIVDPWSAKVIQLTDPARFAPAQTVLAWQNALHFGQGLGLVWRILVFLSGLLPAIFAITGITMWLIKRRARRWAIRNRSEAA